MHGKTWFDRQRYSVIGGGVGSIRKKAKKLTERRKSSATKSLAGLSRSRTDSKRRALYDTKQKRYRGIGNSALFLGGDFFRGDEKRVSGKR